MSFVEKLTGYIAGLIAGTVSMYIIYSGNFQMFYQKAAVMDTLVLKPCFLRLYAPLRIHPVSMYIMFDILWFAVFMGIGIGFAGIKIYHSMLIKKRNKRAAVGKHLELPEPHNLYTKKWGNLKLYFFIYS
mgnify:CR=1 FL=1